MFDRIFAELAAKAGKPDRLMIDATHLKAHRTAASLLEKGAQQENDHQIIFASASLPDGSGEPEAD